MYADITIEGADAQIDGDFPLELVIDTTSYFQQGYKFTAKYRMGMWDGKIKLYSRLKKTFPSGLVPFVVQKLQKEGVRVSIEDRRICPPLSPIPNNITLHGVSFVYPYDFQVECMSKMVKEKRGVVAVATGGGKTEIACLVTACLRVPTLFLVPGKEILYQTQKRFASRFGIPTSDIGIIGDGNWHPNQWITISTVASIYDALKAGKEKAFNLLEKIELLFIDECHHAASDSYYDVARSCNAFFRFGLSGTPLKRTDGADLKLVAVTGPILYNVTNKFLIERGVSSEAEIKLVPIRKPDIQKGTPYIDAYRVGITDNLYRNRLLCLIAEELVRDNRKVIILVREIGHGKKIDERLWSFRKQSFITHQFITGKEPTPVRQRALKEFANGEIQVLIATSILDEGVDLPAIDAIILAGSGKSTIKTLQRIGRGLRKSTSGRNLIIVDTIDFQSKYLLQHSYQRLKDYKAEDCFTITEYKIKGE